MHKTTGTVLVAVGDKVENAIAAVMYHARTLVAATGMAVSTEASGAVLDGDVQAQWYEKWYDGLGYCESTCPIMYCSSAVNHLTRHMELSRSKAYRGQGPWCLGFTIEEQNKRCEPDYRRQLAGHRLPW